MAGRNHANETRIHRTCAPRRCHGSLGRALGIHPAGVAVEPAAGSTYLDAEHIVILMQENRSFDHAFGTLQGVRGFNDPRAITLPDGNPVWVQANANGERYVPFRLDIKNTKSTWMGALPHDWADQVDARNHGRYDRWLQAKRSGRREYAEMPLTLGYYTRADIPFYYALADAFTICDQHFCSCLTGTTPNRLYLWTGTIRERQAADSPANVRNRRGRLRPLGELDDVPRATRGPRHLVEDLPERTDSRIRVQRTRRRLAGELRRQSPRIFHSVPGAVRRHAPQRIETRGCANFPARSMRLKKQIASGRYGRDGRSSWRNASPSSLPHFKRYAAERTEWTAGSVRQALAARKEPARRGPFHECRRSLLPPS